MTIYYFTVNILCNITLSRLFYWMLNIWLKVKWFHKQSWRGMVKLSDRQLLFSLFTTVPPPFFLYFGLKLMCCFTFTPLQRPTFPLVTHVNRRDVSPLPHCVTMCRNNGLQSHCDHWGVITADALWVGAPICCEWVCPDFPEALEQALRFDWVPTSFQILCKC